MARVPVYQTKEVSLVAPRPGAEIDITQLTSGIGEGAAAFAKAVAIRQERVRKTDEQMKMIDLDRQFMDVAANTSQLRGRAAIGITSTLDNNRDSMREAFLSDITDPITKANMEVYFDRSFNQQRARTFAYELRQEDIYLAQADEAFISNEMVKLNMIPVGDTESIENSITAMVNAAADRQGEERWSDAIEKNKEQEVTDRAYVTQISRWYKESPDLAYQWFDNNKTVLKNMLSPEAYNTLNNIHTNQYDEAETLRIYKQVRNDYQGNMLAGANFLANPDNYKKYGITNYKHANAAGVMLRGAYNMEQALAEEKQAARLENFSANIGQWTADIAEMEDVAQRNASYDSLKRAIQTEPDLLPSERATWLSNIEKAQYHTDPRKVNNLKEQIDNGTITEPYQIRMHLGDGIGKTTESLEKYLADTKKNRDAGNINYIDRAESDYLRRVRELSTPEQRRGKGLYLRAAELDHFMIRLKAEVQAAGYTAHDPRIPDIVDKLLGKQWYAESTGEPVEETQFLRREAERFEFQTPSEFLPANVVQALQDIYQGTAPTTQTGQTKQLSSIETDYTNLVFYNNNPAAIPGVSVDDKVSFMDNLYQRVYNEPMADSQRETVRNNISYGVGE